MSHNSSSNYSIRHCFSGTSWQRCRVHCARNLLAKVPRTDHIGYHRRLLKTSRGKLGRRGSTH
ncbi:MAG: transposase [Acidimicrobiales bacterium]